MLHVHRLPVPVEVARLPPRHGVCVWGATVRHGARCAFLNAARDPSRIHQSRKLMILLDSPNFMH